MNVNKFLKKLDFSLPKEKENELKKKSAEFVKELKKKLSRKKIHGEVFVGGSFGKGTMILGENYEIDVFVRMKKKYKDISVEIEKVVGNDAKKIHGSRDYFKIEEEDLIFEIVPVLKINKIQDCENVTDFSYFHVGYVKKNTSKKIRREISLAKKFCKTQRVYGAESYIQGFSGYALECLIIHYRSFEKMLRDLVNVKENEKRVIDIKKFYKDKSAVFREINEAKLQSPIILIDPTWKERNVLAALNLETFKKFQKSAKSFLKNPSENYFLQKRTDSLKLSKTDGEFVRIVLETDRQEGDIAGTKMKKFSRYLEREIEKYFYVVGKEFVYSGGKNSEFNVVAKPKKEIIKRGPMKTDTKNVKRFKARNKDVFEKGERIFARVKIDFSLQEFIEKIGKKNYKEMGIISMEVARN